MSREEIKKLLSENSTQVVSRLLKGSRKDLGEVIDRHWIFGEGSFNDKIHFFLTGESPICENGNQRRVVKLSDGYVNCSRQCLCAQEQKKRTMMDRHGVEHAMQSSEIVAKTKETWFERYGTEQLSDINQDQRRETCLERYGSETPLESEIVREAIRAALKERTGFATPFENPEIQDRIQEHFLTVNGKRSYVETPETRKLRHEDAIRRHFGSKSEILLNQDIFVSEMRVRSRNELAEYIGCSPSLIDKRISQWDLVEFKEQPSYYEVLIGNLLDDLGLNYVKNTRTVIAPKELDFYIPDKKLAIEFNGLRWHSEISGNKDRNYHLLKTQECLDKGIRLIHIFQDEWDQNSEIVRDLISKALGKVSRVIPGRETRVVAISEKDSRVFLKSNHLQGFRPGSTTRLGLLYGDELVSVMTFTVKNNETELVRFANKLGVSVLGGASKLFKFYIRRYLPESMFTFSDRRWFTGDLYQKLGFDLIHNSGPSYFYTKGIIREHRSLFTKKRLIEQGHDGNKTEWQIMQSLGYDRVWDCGHLKWVWKRS